MKLKMVISCVALCVLAACASVPGEFYHDPNLDLAMVQNVAVMPFQNLSRDQQAGDRVRDVFITKLLASGIYVAPVGELAKVTAVLGLPYPPAPSQDEIVKLAAALKVEAVITGVVREYGEVRSASSASNVISMSVQMAEGQTGKIVWTAASTKGGVGLKERLLGGGGDPFNDVTISAVDEIINNLFK